MVDLTVYSSIGVRSAAEELFRKFEKQSACRLAVTWGTAPMLVGRIEAGERADVLILSHAGIDALRKQSKVLAGTDVTLAGSGVAIAVKAGKPKPDISTPEALKQTLLKAKSVAYSEPSAGGASGVYFAKLLERMGIAEQMKPKTKYPPAGGFSAELLLTGAAKLAVQQKPESARRPEPCHRICRGRHDRERKRGNEQSADREFAIAWRRCGVPV